MSFEQVVIGVSYQVLLNIASNNRSGVRTCHKTRNCVMVILWIQVDTQELILKKIEANKILRIINIFPDTICPSDKMYLKYFSNSALVFCPIQNNNKIHRSKKLQGQVQSLTNHKIDLRLPSYCIDDNRGCGKYHCATRYAQCVSTFAYSQGHKQ